MYDTLFDRWLYESESDSLDFKRDQYKFIKATDQEKSEMLKDILSMVNSWRSVDGYIVIGIEDKPEKPNLIHGIYEHIDDAKIQQFVNSKISGTCLFEYATYTKDSKTIGIIRIPVQKRPVYLTKDYGTLKADIVYVRRGSSTGIAKPDEVSKMGLDKNEVAFPNLEVGFFNILNNQMIGDVLKKETSYLTILDSIPEYSEGVSFKTLTVGNNSEYYKDYIEFINFKYSYIPLHFAVKNIGEIEAVNLQFELEIYSSDIEVLLDGNEVVEPDTSILSNLKSLKSIQSSSYRFDKHEGLCKFYNTLDLLHAKRSLALNGTVYLQVKKSDTLKAKATLFFDGQSKPYEKELEVIIKCKTVELSWKDFYEKVFKNNG
jgi:hypothetical protein